MPQSSITKICLKITCLKFHSNFPGSNELNVLSTLCFCHSFIGTLLLVGAPLGRLQYLEGYGWNWPVLDQHLTHPGRDKMAAIFHTTFLIAFSLMKMFEFRLEFHWSLFLRFQLTINHHWFRLWHGADQATSNYLNQWWLDYPHIYARPEWVNNRVSVVTGTGEIIMKCKLYKPCA